MKSFVWRISIFFGNWLRFNSILVVILLLATILRFLGTNPGFNQFHPDEGISYSSAIEMTRFTLDPKRYDYPALVPTVNYLIFNIYFLPKQWIGFYLNNFNEFSSGDLRFPLSESQEKKVLQNNILGNREINALFWGRYVTAFFGVGGVFLTYLLGKKMFNKDVGLVTAFLLTFNFKHVQNSHIGLPDIYNSFFLLIALILSTNILRKSNIKNYLLAGMGVGLSFSTKYQFFSAFPLLWIHLLQSLGDKKINLRKLFGLKIIYAFFIAGFVFVLINPYFFIHLDKAVRSIEDVSSKYAMGKRELNLYPIWYFVSIDYGWPIFISSILGLLIVLKKYFSMAIIFLSVLIPFYFIFLYYSNGGFYVRNFITVTPLILILSGVFVVDFSNYIYSKFNINISIIIFICMLFILIAVPGYNSITDVYGYTKPWNYDVLKQWELLNLPKNSIVASHPFDPIPDPLNVTRTEFGIDKNFSLAEHKEGGASYALLNLDWGSDTFYFWMNSDLLKYTGKLEKPLDLMRNTYYGLAAEELFRYQIFSIVKPWQASDANLILAKLPIWPKTIDKVIKKYSFDNDMDGWSELKNTTDVSSFSNDLMVGNNKSGAIKMEAKNKSIYSRLISPPILVIPNHLYYINAFIKADKKLDPKERDGFLRIDFLKDAMDVKRVGINASVSSRIYETTEWNKKELIALAPVSAKYMVISFQIDNPQKMIYWLDDVELAESSEAVEDITKKQPYNYKEIDLNLLYPNSHGNL